MKNKPDIAFEASSGNVFSGSVKGVAHLEGSGQAGTVHRASVFSERGPCSDPVFPRCAGRVTSSHPGCRRQWYQLRSEPHQSPIRIKASERASRRISSGPWHVVPQTTVGSRSCPPYARTGCRAASWLAPTPFWLTTEAPQSPMPVARERTGWRLRLIGSAGSRPNPFASSQLHPSSIHRQPKARDISNGTCARNM